MNVIVSCLCAAAALWMERVVGTNDRARLVITFHSTAKVDVFNTQKMDGNKVSIPDLMSEN